MTAGPIVNGEQFAPGYTPEAAAYEQATRPAPRQLTIEFLTPDALADTAWRQRLSRPVSNTEWQRIEKGRPNRRRKPVNPHSPCPVGCRGDHELTFLR